MAGIGPFFITGANAKIKLNNRTVAFCQDFSYSVTVKHASPKVLGRYEVDSIEPLSYEVVGSFSVIRYARGAAEALRATSASGSFDRVQENPDVELIDEDGNRRVVQQKLTPATGTRVPSFGTSTIKTPAGVADSGNGIGGFGHLTKGVADSDGRAGDSLNPASFKLATWFDIEVWQKIAGGQQRGVAKIRDCRIEKADFSIAGRRAAAVQRFTFKAVFLDEDSFIAGFTGATQQFT